MKDDPIENMFNDESTKPESNWFTFENVGDTVGGELLEVLYDQKSNFGPQAVYVIKKTDGKTVNVGLKNTTDRINIQNLKAAAIGDFIAIRYKESVDTGKGNPVKSKEVRIRHVNPK